MNPIRTLLLCFALCMSLPAAAQVATPPPAWEQLTPAQRDELVAPIRERWNRNPGERARMLERARSWRTMSPEQRSRAHRGMRRWEHMDPQKRDEMRAVFGQMRDATPEQRKALRERLRGMTTAERKVWVEAHRPAERKP